MSSIRRWKKSAQLEGELAKAWRGAGSLGLERRYGAGTYLKWDSYTQYSYIRTYDFGTIPAILTGLNATRDPNEFGRSNICNVARLR
jgi:hypothetical protein